MRKTKRMFPVFSFYDRTGIAFYLQRMALEGWLLEKVGPFSWKFRRIRPQKVHFAVTYFPDASAFDPHPSEKQLRFQDFCEHTGWKLAASNAQMQIYYNEDLDPTPIETDAVIDVENVHRSVKSTYLPTYFTQMILGVLQLGLQANRFFLSPLENLASMAFLFTVLSWILVLLLTVVEVVTYYRWYAKAKKAAALDGTFIATRGHGVFQVVIVVLVFAALAFMLISYTDRSMLMIVSGVFLMTIAVLFIAIGGSSLMKRLNVSAAANRLITMIVTLILTVGICGIIIFAVIERMDTDQDLTQPAETYEFNGWSYNIYHDEIPLRIEDLSGTEYDGYSTTLHQSESFLVSCLEGRQYPRKDALDQPELEYRIISVHVPFLYNWCVELMLDDFAHNYGRSEPEDPDWKKHVLVDAAPWGANAVYQLWIGGNVEQRYLLCYDSCIIEIDFGPHWTPTDAQMKAVGSILGS